jgi:hypothetical protein
MSVTCCLDSAAPSKGLSNSDGRGTGLLRDGLERRLAKSLIIQEGMLTRKEPGTLKLSLMSIFHEPCARGLSESC